MTVLPIRQVCVLNMWTVTLGLGKILLVVYEIIGGFSVFKLESEKASSSHCNFKAEALNQA